MNFLERKKEVVSFSIHCPDIINFKSAIPNILTHKDGSWELEFLIYGKINKLRDVPIKVGLLLSDWYCFEDELVIENEDVEGVIATINPNGGYGFSIRGLTAYDEYYFRPFAIYKLGGKSIVLYGSILNNELLQQIYKPVFLPSTDEDIEEKEEMTLAEWIKQNGYENAGITTYLVKE